MKKMYKANNSTHLVVDCQGGAFQLAFTKEELEEGLRILNEKPIFVGKTTAGTVFNFQKQSDGSVKYNISNLSGAWVDWLSDWFLSYGAFNTPSIHRAIADALES